MSVSPLIKEKKLDACYLEPDNFPGTHRMLLLVRRANAATPQAAPEEPPNSLFLSALQLPFN